MLHQLARRLLPSVAAVGRPGLPGVEVLSAGGLARQVQSGAWARAADSESSNTGSPSATQGGPGTAPGASPTPSIKAPNQEVTHADFHRCADIYLGGLWNQLESQLRKTEGDSFEYDVNMTSGCLTLNLPNDAKVVVCKTPGDFALHVESNLHDVYGGGDPRDEAEFRLTPEGDFSDGGMELHDYLEDHLAKHLKVQLDLEPQPRPKEEVYGPDPT